MAALAGLRWGKAAALTVGQLRQARPGAITVDRQVGRDEHGEPVIEDPKSETGFRTLSIPDGLRDVLASHLATADIDAAEGDRLLFPGPGGGPLDYGWWRRRVWVPAAVAAGFFRRVPDDQRPGVMRVIPTLGFHDLRRLNAAEMVRLNVDVKTAQHRLGHSDPWLTLAVYAEATTEADREAAARLGARLLAQRAETTSDGQEEPRT